MIISRLPCAVGLAVGLTLASGCRTEYDNQPARRSTQILDVTVLGNLDPHTCHHVAELKDAVASIDTDFPIMSIRFIDAKTAEVTTGLSRGPLEGGGCTYLFLRSEGGWTPDLSQVKVWMY